MRTPSTWWFGLSVDIIFFLLLQESSISCLFLSSVSPGKDLTRRNEKTVAAGPLPLGVQVSSFFSPATPCFYTVGGPHCGRQSCWDLWMLDVFHKAPVTTDQLCSQLPGTYSLFSWMPWPVGQLVLFEGHKRNKSCVRYGPGPYRAMDSEGTYKEQLGWLHTYILIRISMVKYLDFQCSKIWRKTSVMTRRSCIG